METATLVRQLGLWSSGRGPLQQKLARALMDVIRHGDVAPGLRLPSERALAGALQISRTTVVAAYDALREHGWLDSRAGSGTWVCRRSSVVSAARSSAQESALAASPLLGLLDQRGDEDVVELALGTPLPLEELPAERFTLPGDEHAALLRDRGYYPFGLPALRQAIAAEFCRSGLPTDREQVLVTNGAQHAFMLCAMLSLQRGDTALLEDPTYFGAIDACRAIGARIATVPVGPGGATPAAIRGRMTAAGARLIYLTTTFQNPTGTVMPIQARKDLARMVSEFGVTVVDDRTMADLILEGSPPPPLAAFAPDQPILTIGSLSKLVWPGLRVGWIRAPEPIVQRLARLKSAMDLGSPITTQAVAARLVGALDEVRGLRSSAVEASTRPARVAAERAHSRVDVQGAARRVVPVGEAAVGRRPRVRPVRRAARRRHAPRLDAVGRGVAHGVSPAAVPRRARNAAPRRRPARHRLAPVSVPHPDEPPPKRRGSAVSRGNSTPHTARARRTSHTARARRTRHEHVARRTRHEHVARRTISARSTQHAARSTCYALGTNLYPGSRC